MLKFLQPIVFQGLPLVNALKNIIKKFVSFCDKHQNENVCFTERHIAGFCSFFFGFYNKLRGI